MSDAPPNGPAAGAAPSSDPLQLEPGTLIGGTYRIERRLGGGGLGPLYQAVDVRSDAVVALRALAPELTSHPEVVASLRAQIELVSALKHKNVVRTFGMAAEGDMLFVVTEHVVGQALREIIERKRRTNKPFTLKGAYNIVAHLCNACGYAHETTSHGALNPGNILVNKAGRIKIAEFGFASGLSGLGNFESLLGGNGYLYLAPELTQNPRAADGRADIYAIGVILNELITGRSPAESFEAPSTVRPGLPVEVDQVIGRCMRPMPDDRFDSIQMLKLSLMGALENVSEAPEDGRVASSGMPTAAAAVDIDIDIDFDEPSSGRPSPASGLPAGLPPPPPQADADPFGASLGDGAPPLIGSSQDAFDLDTLISDATGDEEEKYLISKGGLEYGPFALTEVKRQIASADIMPNDLVVEIDTGKRQKVKVHPLFKDFTEEVERRREARRRAEAESATETTERRKSRVLMFGVIAAVGVIALAVGSILIYQGISKKKKGPSKRGGDEVSEYEGSDEDPTGMKRRGRGRYRRRGGGSGGSTGLSMRLDATEGFDFTGMGGGGSERLSPSVIRSTIDQRKNRVGGCMISAGSKSISVFVQVKGSGKLGYVSTKPKAAAGCVRRALRGLRFPSFNGKLTQGSYYLSM
ncbi:MAG: serine/threonine-protein kinase [bacterium]